MAIQSCSFHKEMKAFLIGNGWYCLPTGDIPKNIDCAAIMFVKILFFCVKHVRSLYHDKVSER